MADPMKIRARLDGDVLDVRVLMAHPMETGQRKDGAGNVVPLHFIQTITAQLNGKPVFEAETSQAISRNPVFGFKVKGAKTGDKLSITWTDNKGDKRTDEVTVGPAEPAGLAARKKTAVARRAATALRPHHWRRE
jgi:sulfur-oxidizing protein SoxZ